MMTSWQFESPIGGERNSQTTHGSIVVEWTSAQTVYQMCNKNLHVMVIMYETPKLGGVGMRSPTGTSGRWRFLTICVRKWPTGSYWQVVNYVYLYSWQPCMIDGSTIAFCIPLQTHIRAMVHWSVMHTCSVATVLFPGTDHCNTNLRWWLELHRIQGTQWK